MDSKLYGFIIDGDILYAIASRNLIYYSNEVSENAVILKVVSLNEVQARLLIHLLVNCKDTAIDKINLMKNVWDTFGLPSSNQRLWRTINELKRKLSAVGVGADFITNIHGVGYVVDNRRVVSLFVA